MIQVPTLCYKELTCQNIFVSTVGPSLINFLWQCQVTLRTSSYVIVVIQGRNIAIFYGSQTGTAEEFAGRLAKDAQRYGMKALVLDPEGGFIKLTPMLKKAFSLVAVLTLVQWSWVTSTNYRFSMSFLA